MVMNLNYKYDLQTICDDTDFCDKTLLRCPVWVLWEYPGEDISTITSRTPQSHIVSFPVILGYYKSFISSTKQKKFLQFTTGSELQRSLSNIYPNWPFFFFSFFCKWLEMAFLNQQNKLQLVQWQTGKRDLTEIRYMMISFLKPSYKPKNKVKPPSGSKMTS